jgi:hypothetical protein
MLTAQLAVPLVIAIFVTPISKCRAATHDITLGNEHQHVIFQLRHSLVMSYSDMSRHSRFQCILPKHTYLTEQ